MSDDDGLAGCVGQIIGVLLVVALVVIAIYYIAMAALIIGGVYGGLVSVANYAKSFDKNVMGGKLWKSNRQN